MLKSIFLLFVFPLLAFSQSQVTNDEISKKLDLIMQKISDLEKRVVKLESSSVEVRQEVQDVAKSAEEAKKSIQSIPQEPEKEIISSKLGQSAQNTANPRIRSLDKGVYLEWKCVKIFHPCRYANFWVTPPRSRSRSTTYRPDVYLLRDLDADGGEDQGIVSFYRNRVVNFESPFE